jgi:hypothetical protein
MIQAFLSRWTVQPHSQKHTRLHGHQKFALLSWPLGMIPVVAAIEFKQQPAK